MFNIAIKILKENYILIVRYKLFPISHFNQISLNFGISSEY